MASDPSVLPKVIEPIQSATIMPTPGVPLAPSAPSVPSAPLIPSTNEPKKPNVSPVVRAEKPGIATATPPTETPKKDKVYVSQFKFWIEGDQTTNSNTIGGGTYLSYTVFLALSVLGGLLALDHLYLRSPLTFLAKIGVNLFYFGVWWIWDVCQAIFNEPVVRSYGLGIPGYGPHGIGAGVLVMDDPGKKHLRFFMYSLAVTFGGLIGLDSFLVGVVEEYALFFEASSGKNYRKSGLFHQEFIRIFIVNPVVKKMIPLRIHDQFEEIISRKEPIVMIKFGATWCGPYKRIDKDVLAGLSGQIKWYDCDLDENEDSPAYCGVEKIPAFLAIVGGQPKSLFQSSNTNQVIAWMQGGFTKPM